MAKLGDRTIFLDIDGCILKVDGTNWFSERDVLPGVQKQMLRWWNLGYKIILTTGRPECMRELTAKNLQAHKLFYHQLIMDCGNGVRILINDLKPYDESIPTARSINIKRNVGLKGVVV